MQNIVQFTEPGVLSFVPHKDAGVIALMQSFNAASKSCDAGVTLVDALGLAQRSWDKPLMLG